MGPFKHEVDDGLDLRKAAFECMYTLLDTCIDRIDVFEFLSHVQDGLKDHYDIKVWFFRSFMGRGSGIGVNWISLISKGPWVAASSISLIKPNIAICISHVIAI